MFYKITVSLHFRIRNLTSSMNWTQSPSSTPVWVLIRKLIFVNILRNVTIDCAVPECRAAEQSRISFSADLQTTLILRLLCSAPLPGVWTSADQHTTGLHLSGGSNPVSFPYNRAPTHGHHPRRSQLWFPPGWTSSGRGLPYLWLGVTFLDDLTENRENAMSFRVNRHARSNSKETQC